MDHRNETRERLGGMERILGAGSLERLGSARVLVAGLGGVGSWAAEALARSGVGCIHLLDGDTCAPSNTNRQLHAMDGNYGISKARLMEDRLGQIQPGIALPVHVTFLSEDNVAGLVTRDLDFVVDAMDSVPDKAALFLRCRELGIPLAMSGAGGGRLDPTRIVCTDLGSEEGDPLLKAVKRYLRGTGFSPIKDRKGRDQWGTRCVWSREPVHMPAGHARPDGRGSRMAPEDAGKAPPSPWGAACFCTGAFGFALASVAVRHLAGIFGARDA